MTASPVVSPRQDRGETTTQLVILIPLVVLLLLCGIHAAAWFHAGHVATASAARGAAAGSMRDGTERDAVTAARRLAVELGADLRDDPAVSMSGSTVTVSVAVGVPRITPFFPRTVRRQAVEPKERFVQEGER